MNLGEGPTAAELDVTLFVHTSNTHLSSSDIPEHSRMTA